FVPYAWFTLLLDNALSASPAGALTPSQAASTINGVFWLSFAETAGLLAVFAIVIPMVLSILIWRNTVYAMTDRRALKVTGILGRFSRDAALDKIQDVTMNQGAISRALGCGDLIMSTAAGGGDSASGFRTERQGRGIAWFGVPDPLEVRRQVHEMSEGARQTMREADYRQMATAFREAGTPIPQTLAGGPVASRPVAAGSRLGQGLVICPRCGTAAGFSSELGGFYCSSCKTPV
ncbi:MAG: PH domain-containing protein, partial [Thermoplasmata archaeon]|nr:PH domain-containing protein [Thermoplasmata archaeon]